MLTFLNLWLAVAGAVAALVPVVLHLLNRRKFRVVQWAAMDFLREALTRSRRMMELRDLLLLLLRVACLLLFGAALARPYWSHVARQAVDPNQPVHAVVLVDNSLSMSYQNGDGILLDAAKARAKEFIENLPAGSLISVLPACGSADGVHDEPCRSVDDALAALTAIRPVDRAARSGPVIDLALEASRRPVSVPGRRIFFVTDQQVANWSGEAERDHLKQLPCAMQVVQVTADEFENVSVADVRLRDGVATAQSPAVFIATIHYEGRHERHDVEVVLTVDGKTAATQTVDLQPGQSREVLFPEYIFPPPNKPGQIRYAAAEVSIAPETVPFDRLPDDNRRSIVVPVTDSLPVVFVDAVGEHEDADRKIRGDTWSLRRWLAPPSSRTGKEHPLVQVRHLTIGQLDRKVLSDARLAVIAGVSQPSPAQVTLLREYVEQGGKLLLAAGGTFDPAAWTDTAWQDGLGILPAPLAPRAVGHVRDDWSPQSAAPPLTLDVGSLVHHYFRPEGVSEEDLRGLFGPPVVFLKIVVASVDDALQERVAKAAREYFANQRAKLAEIDRRLAALQSSGTSESQKEIDDLQQERQRIQPSWLTWKTTGLRDDEEQLTVDDLAQRARPQTLARYSNQSPMLLRRRWGRGEVLFLTTSLSRDWTTLHDHPQSAWLMDRIARSLLADTLPSWNGDGENALVMPVAVGERAMQFTLIDPAGNQKVLSVDALGGERYGVALGGLTERGIYRVQAARGGAATGEDSRLWEIPVAVNGPAEESQLAPARQTEAGQRSFVDVTAEASSSSPLQFQGVDLWKWLVVLVLVLLLAELLVAAGAATKERGKAEIPILLTMLPTAPAKSGTAPPQAEAVR